MTECPNVEMRDRLPDLANETLEPSMRVLVLAHVESCAACAAEIEIVRSTRLWIVQSTPRVNVSAIVSALPRHGVIPISQAPSARRRSWASWRAAAAITVLAAGVGSYAVLKPGSPVGTIDSAGMVADADGRTGLALTGALAGLSEAELTALVKDIDAIDALPSTQIETASVISMPAIVPDSIARQMEDF
jgi:hypothetical protein